MPDHHASATGDRASLVPADHQPDLPLERLVRSDPPSGETVPLDVLFVGGGPAGLAGAIELARLARQSDEPSMRNLEVGVLEKASALGEHCLSGAVVNPRALHALFPDLDIEDMPLRGRVEAERVYLLTGARSRLRLPTPPTMRNHGNYVASLCELVRWLGEHAESWGVHLLTGFSGEALLVEDDAVRGVRTAASGIGRDGERTAAYLPPTDVTARVTVLAEGNRGPLTQAWRAWQQVGSPNPQIHALGVKGCWRVEQAPDAVIHTLGWPLGTDVFGGAFCYPMAGDLVAIGLVAGLDYPDAGFDVHERLQALKNHRLFEPLLRDGELLEWGAKTIPEGGFFSLPDRLSGEGLLLAGDSAGLVDVPSLKGIHYAIESGIQAARVIHSSLASKDVSSQTLSGYDDAIRHGYVVEDLYRTRDMRLAFKRGFVRGGLSAAWSTLTGGRGAGGSIAISEDAAEPRRLSSARGVSRTGTPGRAASPPERGGRRALSKVDAVFRSGNDTSDDLPSHLLVPDHVSPELASFYAHMCPAGVYDEIDGELVVSPSNCIDCKTTDVLGPRWLPREGGTGPRYERM